jgi:hypothetical protein
MTLYSHRNWIKFMPMKKHEMQRPIRRMLWIRSDLEAEQMPIPSADLMGAILCRPHRKVLVVSVYVEGKLENALRIVMVPLHTAIASFRNSTGKRTDVILAGDFNRNDQLWGGNEVTGRRQGEAGRSSTSWMSTACSTFSLETDFDLTAPERTAESRLLFKIIPWNAIRARVQDRLAPLSWVGGIQEQTDR